MRAFSKSANIDMKILSIDVGIKNLAFCLFDNDNDNKITINKWDCINVSEQIVQSCSILDKNGSNCKSPAKFSKESKCFCLKHAKKQNYQIPNADLKSSHINKQKLQSLYELADKYNLKYDKPCKKCNLISVLNNYSTTMCFQPINNVNASKTDLITIGKNIKIRFDEIFINEIIEQTIDFVIIENQISPIANRMKTIQGMIAQYFIMNNTNQNIVFVSSTNKLKGLDENENKGEKEKQEKSNYKDRKKLGIEKCLEILKNNQQHSDWVTYFTSHKKKDDLADSFLQGCAFRKSAQNQHHVEAEE